MFIGDLYKSIINNLIFKYSIQLQGLVSANVGKKINTITSSEQFWGPRELYQDSYI